MLAAEASPITWPAAVPGGIRVAGAFVAGEFAAGAGADGDLDAGGGSGLVGDRPGMYGGIGCCGIGVWPRCGPVLDVDWPEPR